MLWFQKGGWQVLGQDILYKVVLHLTLPIWHHIEITSSELNMLKCLRWARWGWNCCKSPLSLAWLIFFSQFMLEGLWLALHQSVCCGTNGGKPLWPPSVSQCHQEQTVVSICGGTVDWLRLDAAEDAVKQSFNVPEHNSPEVWGQAVSALWSALQLQSWNSLPLPCGHCSAKGNGLDLHKGLWGFQGCRVSV